MMRVPCAARDDIAHLQALTDITTEKTCAHDVAEPRSKSKNPLTEQRVFTRIRWSASSRTYCARLAEWTGLEPATPGVTGRYSNQLNYHSPQLDHA